LTSRGLLARLDLFRAAPVALVALFAHASFPSSARANPFGYHEHDGFYLRVSVGPALLDVSRDTERDGQGPSDLFAGDHSSVNGVGPALELSLGATPFDRFVIAGTLLTIPLGDTDLTFVDGSSVPLDASLEYVVIAPTVDVFPARDGGFHFGGGFGLAIVESSVDLAPGGLGGVGGAALARAGYGFWIDDDWSLGGVLSGTLGRVDGEHTGGGVVGREKDLVTSMALSFSALYH
jgi:hypothetical protein